MFNRGLLLCDWRLVRFQLTDAGVHLGDCFLATLEGLALGIVHTCLHILDLSLKTRSKMALAIPPVAPVAWSLCKQN